MAKWISPAAIFGILVASGCQPAPSSSVVQTLPPPNFSGPSFQEKPVAVLPPAPQPAPRVAVAPKPQPAPTPTRATPSGRVPADWIPVAAAGQWYYIVIHHSATPTGGAAAFDKEHKAKGWDELGYHFVIGNGTDTRDGQIEVGPRWRKQKWGAHAKTPDNRFNDHGIGICLVGNFDVTRPTAKQLESVSRLVAYLESTYRISSDHVVGHGSVHNLANGGTITECPGRNLSLVMVRKMSSRLVAEGEFGDIPMDGLALNPAQEMLVNAKQ